MLVGCISLLAVLMAVEMASKVFKETTSEPSRGRSCRDCPISIRCSSQDTSSARSLPRLCSPWWINFMHSLDSAQSQSFYSQVCISPPRKGAALSVAPRLPVCLSVCPMSALNSRTKRSSQSFPMAIVSVMLFKVQRSKVKSRSSSLSKFKHEIQQRDLWQSLIVLLQSVRLLLIMQSGASIPLMWSTLHTPFLSPLPPNYSFFRGSPPLKIS